ncbi:MAG: hypothetical protein JHD02_00020 [Thermoleophilaceae bacterium]|nr:hypothetical protein [Thermoleophilaceae bacterium]
MPTREEILSFTRAASELEQPFEVDRLAELEGVLDWSAGRVLATFARAETFGLFHADEVLDELGRSVVVVELSDAGSQFLTEPSRFPDSVLGFMGQTVFDLHARSALVRAGREFAQEYQEQLGSGRGAEYVKGLLPEGFAVVADEQMAAALFGSLTALLARLSSNEPAACIAEEIVAVTLLERASDALASDKQAGVISEQESWNALEELGGIWMLFGDDDVLELFGMREPADAAIELRRSLEERESRIDKRVEAWFDVMQGAVPTGLLREQKNPVGPPK